MSDNETPENKRILDAAVEVAREAADPGPELGEILFMELGWEIEEYADEIVGLCVAIRDIRDSRDRSPTAAMMRKIQGLRDQQTAYYDKIAVCNQRLTLVCQSFDVCPNCGKCDCVCGSHGPDCAPDCGS